MNQQTGFAIMPLIIAIAAIVLMGGGSAAVYSVQKNNESEKSTLHQEIKLLQEQQADSTQELVKQGQLDSSLSPTSSPTSTPTLKPVVKAATTVAPTVQAPAPTAPTIPLIVEQEFTHVFGRKPTSEESTYWKERYRKNGADKAKLRVSMQRDKEIAESANTANELQSTPSSSTKTAEGDLLKIERCKNEAQTTYDNFMAAGTMALREAANQRLESSTSIVPIGAYPGAGAAYLEIVQSIRANIQQDLDRESGNLRIQADSNYNKQYAECLNERSYVFL